MILGGQIMIFCVLLLLLHGTLYLMIDVFACKKFTYVEKTAYYVVRNNGDVQKLYLLCTFLKEK